MNEIIKRQEQAGRLKDIKRQKAEEARTKRSKKVKRQEEFP